MARISWFALGMCVFLAGCSSDDEGPQAPAAVEVAGAQVDMDFAANWSDPAPGEFNFFRFPYPSDLRLDAGGAPDMAGVPNFYKIPLLDGLKVGVPDHKGFPMVPVAYFHFNQPISQHEHTDVIAASADSPVMLLDIDEASPKKGELIPVVASTIPTGEYIPVGTLGVAARPGFVLRPKTKYAFVVMRKLGDASGKPLGVPLALEQLKANIAPTGEKGAQALELYRPLWAQLKALNIQVADVAAATVFTTGDVVAELADLSEKLRAAYKVGVKNLAVDPDDGANHARYCELHGTITYPQFQTGVPPYKEKGLFTTGTDGLPVKQRDEDAKVVLTLPKGEMPAEGYPLYIYYHGSGGLSTQGVDRGTWRALMEPSGCPLTPGKNGLERKLGEYEGTKGCTIPGEGPSHIVAEFGMASASSALNLNPERLPDASDYAYINLNNFMAMRDTFRQGVIEQRLFIDALERLEIDPASVSGCSGLSLPAGQSKYRFNIKRLVAGGQSMGAMYTNMVSAVEPRIRAAVPTGAGGFWSYFILETTLFGNTRKLIQLVMGEADVPINFMHPALTLFETSVEAADPMVYMPRVSARPLPGVPARPIYQPIGKDDSYFPTTVLDAMTLAYGHHQTGSVVWPETQTGLELMSKGGLLPYSVKNNLTSENGESYTGVMVQYPGDGVYDPHAIYGQLDEVKYQYGCFLDSYLKTGTAVVPAPAALGTPCPTQ